MKTNFLIILYSLLIFKTHSLSQNSYIPSDVNLKNRQWFQDSKFGLFIHRRIYSVLGDGEWVMQQKRIDKKTYKRIASFFNPIDFDPAEWVSIAKKSWNEIYNNYYETP